MRHDSKTGGEVRKKTNRFKAFTCMWLCSDEVEEKPRLHTLHLNGLLELEMTRCRFRIEQRMRGKKGKSAEPKQRGNEVLKRNREAEVV